jgi:beta-lactamase class A
VRALADAPPLVSVRADQQFAAACVIKLAILLTAHQAFDAGTAAHN